MTTEERIAELEPLYANRSVSVVCVRDPEYVWLNFRNDEPYGKHPIVGATYDACPFGSLDYYHCTKTDEFGAGFVVNAFLFDLCFKPV